jgi:hypothetical protein
VRGAAIAEQHPQLRRRDAATPGGTHSPIAALRDWQQSARSDTWNALDLYIALEEIELANPKRALSKRG